ncbi:MAG: 50S ribosomal protein L2 [Flavobacteriales bacterium]
MAVKKLRPMTPSQRHMLVDNYDDLTAGKPEQSLLVPNKRSGGRNADGKMTMRYIGGGHKKMYRIIDFKRENHGVAGTVKSIEYDPNRSARIALVEYTDGEKRYILAPQGLQVGMKLQNGTGAAPELGNALFLKDLPLGTTIHNIEMKPGKGGSIARSAGSYAQLTSRDGRYAVITMPSGENRLILGDCIATVGVVSNAEHNLQVSGKAGRSRWLGRRPRVRGVAMNPVDHPMGGGEGRQSGGLPRSRKGTPAKGYKTRQPKNPSNRFILERRKK